MEQEQRDKLVAEAQRVEESAKWSGQGQFEQAKIWRGANLTLGAPASVLAAIAGTVGLATTAGRYWAAIAALVASALGAVMASLNLGRKIEEAHTAANEYLALQQDARVFYDIDVDTKSFNEARTALADLITRQQKTNAAAPMPSRRAYRRAKRNIEGGGQTYEVDQPRESHESP